MAYSTNVVEHALLKALPSNGSYNPAPVATSTELHKIKLWYASYGSNMDMERFLCYIEGGQVVGMQKPNKGSQDKTRPSSTKWSTIPYRMFFGRNSTAPWGPGGVAFLDLQKHKSHKAYIRLYKISLQQFNDVLIQENDGKLVKNSPLFSLTELNSITQTEGCIIMRALKKGWYHTVLYVGQTQGLPILTFTCSPQVIEEFKYGELPLSAPSEAYKDVILTALVDVGKLSFKEATGYIRDCYKKPLKGPNINNLYCRYRW